MSFQAGDFKNRGVCVYRGKVKEMSWKIEGERKKGK